MEKRRREDSDQEILKKLEEIQSQINKRRRISPPRRRRVRCISSEDESNNIIDNADNTTSDVATTSADVSGPSTSYTSPTQQIHNASAALPSTAEPCVTSDQAEQPEDELDEEILQLLGDAPKTETQLGPNINNNIASRWLEILTKGLPKETKENMLKEHLVPANCEVLIPPLLNAEVKAGLPDSLVKRDAFLAERQKQIGVALAAIANATHMLIKKDDHTKILKSLSDAGRLLCDVHHNETKSRRSFIISGTNANLKDTMMNTKPDKYLFGENVSDTVKSAKSIQKLGADLKQPQRSTFNPKFHKSNFYKNKPLNTRALQRKTSGKPDVGKLRAPAATTAAATTRSTNRNGPSAHRRSPPPPPRKPARRY